MLVCRRADSIELQYICCHSTSCRCTEYSVTPYMLVSRAESPHSPAPAHRGRNRPSPAIFFCLCLLDSLIRLTPRPLHETMSLALTNTV